eukprot:5982867-Amphidinium_carterae.1
MIISGLSMSLQTAANVKGCQLQTLPSEYHNCLQHQKKISVDYQPGWSVESFVLARLQWLLVVAWSSVDFSRVFFSMPSWTV